MKFLLLALTGLSCLLSPPLKAQPISPLRPLVVRLDSGMTVQRPLIGIDPTTYQAVRLGQDSDQRLLLVRASRIVNLLAIRRADSLALVASAAEVRRYRRESASLSQQLTEQEIRTEKVLNRPLQKPFIFDRNTWLGIGAGLLGGLIYGAVHR